MPKKHRDFEDYCEIKRTEGVPRRIIKSQETIERIRKHSERPTIRKRRKR